MSRAACSAMVASLACNEPQCLCARPLRLRMKTSQSGVFGVAICPLLFRGLRKLAPLALFGIGGRRLAHPGAVSVRLAPRRHALAVAGAVAGEHLLEFAPVDLAVTPVSFRILRHAGIGNGEPEEFCLRHGRVDEFLTQLVVGEALDLPFGRSIAVLA